MLYYNPEQYSRLEFCSFVFSIIDTVVLHIIIYTNPGTDSLTPTLLQLTQYWLGLYFILSDTLDVNVNYDGLVIP